MPSLLLDREDLVGRLFFPSDTFSPPAADAQDHFIDVGGAQLHLRAHASNLDRGVVLLFHGNGETVAAWDESAPVFAKHGGRLWVVDYRGYGRSTGVSTMRRVLDDARVVASWVRAQIGPDTPLIIMGRSLGSAPAWEVASEGRALIIDSGFTDVDALTRRRGLDPAEYEAQERATLERLPWVRLARTPLLLLHGEDDAAISIAEAQAALAACPAEEKSLLTLAGHGHNDLYKHPDYWRSLGAFIDRFC